MGALLVLSLLWAMVTAAEAAADGDGCFSSASIVGAVIGSVLVLLALEVGVYLLWRLYWRSRRGQHLVLVTDPEKGGEYAFDNPCFREGGPVSKAVIDSKDPSKFEPKQNKWTSWGGLGGAIRNNLGGLQGEKRRAMDDSFPTEPQVTQVSLRSHDFTGLGFNICGNMRDGIFVKDVLHRGPASESGLIFPGDRIHSIRISLRHMVFEDALTILSYASPYEVTLEVETGSAPAHSRPSSLLRREREREQEQADRIVHPFYRSQSIADLAQIGKATQKRPHAIEPGRVSPCVPVTSTPAPAPAPARTERSQLEGSAAVLNPSSSVIAKPERAKRNTPSPAEQNAHNALRLNTYTRERGIDVPHNYNPFLPVPSHRTHTPSFDEVDLGPQPQQPPPSDDPDSHHKVGVVAKEVKTKISKGIHSLLHSLDRKKSSARAEDASPVAAEKVRDHGDGEDMREGDEDEDTMARRPSGRGIPTEIPEEVRLAAMAARSNRKSLGALSIEVDADVPAACARASPRRGSSSNKRQAPRPPADSHQSGEDADAMHSDSDSELDTTPGSGPGSGPGVGPRTTIELTASHITIHHSPTLPEEETTRKAASLGDLSRIDSALPSANLLERAMSLDLADGAPQSGKKRKAPPAPSIDDDLLVPDLEDLGGGASRKEPRLEGGLSTFERRLKKSSDWGTLEEALDMGHSAEQVFVLAAPSVAEVIPKGELGSSIFVGMFGRQQELQDDQPFSFTATTESEPQSEAFEVEFAGDRLEPLSIEIRHESPLPLHQIQPFIQQDEPNQVPVHTSRVNVNSVGSRSPSPSRSPGVDSGPASLGALVFSSTPMRPTSSSQPASDALQSPINFPADNSVLRASYVTTTQLNSLEDPETAPLDGDVPSRSEAFVTAVDSLLQDDEDSALSPVSLSSPMSSLTYITEIQVTPTQSDSSASVQNGLTFPGEMSASPPPFAVDEGPRQNGSSSPPPSDPVTNSPSGKNVSVTAIQGSRIPVLRSTSHSPEERGHAQAHAHARTGLVPVRPPVPARRSTEQSRTRKVNGVQIVTPDQA